MPRAGVDVDVRIDASLADEPKLGQALDQRCADRCALADQNERLRILQARGEGRRVRRMIVPDCDVMAREFDEAAERADRVLIVIQYRDVHDSPL